MINKDQKILQEIYTKVNRPINEQLDENTFRSMVKLEVDVDYDTEKSYTEVDAPEQIEVVYSIHIEYRSYGIKGIDTHFVSASPFSIDTIDYDENDDEIRKTINIDLSNLQEINTELNVNKYGQVYPTSLSVKINKNLQPYEAVLVF